MGAQRPGLRTHSGGGAGWRLLMEVLHCLGFLLGPMLARICGRWVTETCVNLHHSAPLPNLLLGQVVGVQLNGSRDERFRERVNMAERGVTHSIFRFTSHSDPAVKCTYRPPPVRDIVH